MKYHLVGIKGVGMANLAVFLKLLGEEVQGSDVKGSFQTMPLLRKYGIKVYEKFTEKNLKGIDRLIYTGAHNGIKNKEVIWASKHGIPIFHLSEFIGRVLLDKFNKKIAIAGTHGKTTTTALTAWSFLSLKQKFGYLVGTPFFNNNIEGVGFTGNDYFVLEADEYAKSPPIDITPKFFEYKNLDYILLTSLDYDHPDVYKNKKSTLLAFKKFLNLNPNSTVIYNCEDLNLVNLAKTINNKKFCYGANKKADVIIENINFTSRKTSFELNFHNNKSYFEINLFGYHNVLNSTAVIILLYLLGFNFQQIRSALKGFYGAKRRLEFKGKLQNKLIFDDYAHHPTEIEAILNALKRAFPQKKILFVFQPHTFSRTLALKKNFISALQKADSIVLLPIFASAREKGEKINIDSKDLVELLLKKHKDARFAANFEQAAKLIKEKQDVDIILTAGAGDVYKCLDYLRF